MAIMKEPFPHDIRAVLSAPGKGLSLKKIFAATVFLVAGYVVYTAFTWLALLYDGVSFGYAWQSYGMFPLRLFSFDAVAALVIYLLGIAAAGVCLSLAVMAAAVITFEELRGDFFYSASDAIRFAIGRIPTMALVYVAVGAFLGFIYLLGVIVGVIARVPLVGESIIGIFYVIPIFLTMVFVVFIIFVLTLSVLVLPVIIAAQRQREVFDALLQLFSVVIKEPVRLVGYIAVTGVLAKVSSFVMAYLFFRTMQFSRIILMHGGGERVERLFNTAMEMLPWNSPVVSFVTNIFPGIRFSFHYAPWGYGGGTTAGAVFLAISFFVLFMVILGYGTAVLAAGLARGYAVIRRMKDDYFIINEEPMANGSDYANPPLGGVNTK
jgi:hypothetical protein